MQVSNSFSADFVVSLLSWLFPVTLLIHLAEEYWGGEGFSAHLHRTRGADLTPRNFILFTGFGVLLTIAGILLAHRFKFPQFMLLILGTITLVNGFSHLITALFKGEYNPGLFSGVLIWIPLGIVSLVLFKPYVSRERYLTALAIGIAIHAMVSILALRGQLLFGLQARH